MDRGNGRVGEAGNSIERFLTPLDHHCDPLRTDLLREGVKIRAGNKNLRFRGSKDQAPQAFFGLEEVQMFV